ncbi:cAMP-dependent protein kinase inhibitor gamma isoform X2 [Pangasianodon hypophthalmus]|uniref:cAMP-dependent protein kinase inhibitor gamma isoform X2 n=1 Tax=Pangasianodon hypophthalmus TaxID=310915 RepID=UPI0023077BDE|nr:cAMP-dependent protein kinase inhibitor gamma isoform X2 [Pangasianodon hypophthalmus]
MKECIFGKEDINATEVPIISSHLLMWNEKTGHGQMMDVESSYSDFVNCDRTGRRNAVPDIKGDGTVVGTSELTKDMAQMDLKAGEADAAGAPAAEAEASSSQEQGKEGAS